MSDESNQGTNDSAEPNIDNTNSADSSAGDNTHGNDSSPQDVSPPENTNQADTDNSDSNDSDDNGEPDNDSESPDWFMKDKFKSTEEQAKAYSELQKKMGKFWGAPKDNYSIDNIEGVSSDDPLVQNLMPALKELGLSQEGFNTLVTQYQQANVKMMQKYADDLKKELTENDVHNYQAVNKWMQESLSPEQVELVQNNWLMTPDDFKLFNQLRLMAAPSTNVPNGNANNAPKHESSKEVTNEKIKYKTEVREGKRVADKNYENELAGRFRDARSRELKQ